MLYEVITQSRHRCIDTYQYLEHGLDTKYYMQEKAIGIASVNEKSMTNVSDGSSIVLGELGLLSRYDYLTTNNGVSKINHVGYSDNYIYCIDIVNKEIV